MKSNFLWWLLFVVGTLMLIGCTQGELEDATHATTDTVVTHGPVIGKEVAEGDWIGVGLAVVTAIVGGVSGYMVYRKKRKKADK